MRNDFLFLISFFTASLFMLNLALATSFTVSITPSTINASKETQLTFIFFNLNDTQNITNLNISIPHGFSLGSLTISISPSEGRICDRLSNIISCSGSPFIEKNSETNVSFSLTANVASPPDYQFYFSTLDTSNEITLNSTNITVNDIDSPIIISVFPGNMSVKYRENAIYIFNASFLDNIKINSIEFFWNDVFEQINYTNSQSFSLQIVKKDLSVGNYNYSWRVNDTSGNFNFSVYFFNVTQAENPLTFYLNNQKNQNITVENGTNVNITIISKGTIYAWLNNAPLGSPREEVFNITYPFNTIGEYEIFANATGNQNYTLNSTGDKFFVKVIYPRLRFKDLQFPSSTTYSPGASYNFRITFYSLAYPLNNISNVSFILKDQIYYLPVTKQDIETYTFTVSDLATDNYNWRFCANDTQNEMNCTYGSFSISQATPQLDIINVQDYVAPVNKTILAVGCPPQLVCNFYLNNTLLQNNYYELVTNEPGYYIFTYNTSGNANYSAASITKTLRVNPRQESATTTTSQSTIIQTTTTTIQSNQQTLPSTKNISSIKAYTPTIFKIENSELLKVSEIEIITNKDFENAEIKVEIASPLEIQKEFVEKNKVFLTYLKISSNVSSEYVEKIRIKFKVEKIWIKANNIDASKVNLYKFENGNWVIKQTKKISEDDRNFYYEASLNSLSLFTIAGEIKSGFPWKIILIIVVAIVAVVVFYLFWPTKNASEYEKLKYKWISKGF
jgi:PGF-pre-PGF domain-containing protein